MQIGGWLTINSKPPRPIIMIDQLEIGSAFYQPQQTVRKCWPKIILLSQTSNFKLFFIQIYCAMSHTEYCWGSSYTYTLLCVKGFEVFTLTQSINKFTTCTHQVCPKPSIWVDKLRGNLQCFHLALCVHSLDTKKIEFKFII